MNQTRFSSKSIYGILCFTLLLTLLPLYGASSAVSIYNGEWMDRLEYLSSGFLSQNLLLYPDTDFILRHSMYSNSMNSNLWLFPAAFVYNFSGNITITWIFSMICLQALTLFGASLFFRRIFSLKTISLSGNSSDQLAAIAGTLLYVTCPYRIFLCYEQYNPFEAIVWMLLPFLGWAIANCLYNPHPLCFILLSGIILSGISYAHLILYLVICTATFFCSLFFRKLRPLGAIGLSMLFSVPALCRLTSYLSGNQMFTPELPISGIMSEGYQFNQLFTSYAFRDAHPGMGLGIMICLFAGIWLAFIHPQKVPHRLYQPFITLFCLLTLFSLQVFPWDFFQRLGSWMLKLISLFHTPAIFWGIALAVFTLPCALIIKQFRQSESGASALGIPLLAVVSCLTNCLYLCYSALQRII